jgi:hypothetical protein
MVRQPSQDDVGSRLTWKKPYVMNAYAPTAAEATVIVNVVYTLDKWFRTLGVLDKEQTKR